MQWLAALCVQTSGLRDGAHPVARPSSASFSFTQLGVDRFPKIDFPTVVGHDACSRAPRRSRSRPRSPTRSRRRSTPSAASTSCARSRPRASRRSSSASCSTRTPTSPRRKCATRSTASCRSCRKTIQQPRVDKLDPDAAPVLSLALERQQAGPRHHRVRRQGAAPAARERRRRRPGARPRRPQAADQRLARRRSAARLQPDGHRRRARAAGAERRDARRPRRSGPAVGDAADARPRRRASAEFDDIVVREKDGHPVRVGDVARVEDGEAEAETAANVERQPATVLLQIRKQSGTNTVEVVDAVKERLDELKATLPAGYNAARRPRHSRSSSRRRSTTSRST